MEDYEAERGETIKMLSKILDVNSQRFSDLKVFEGTDNERYLFDVSTKRGLSDIHQIYFLKKKVGIDKAYDEIVERVIPNIEEHERIGISQVYSSMVFNTSVTDELRKTEEIALSLQNDKGILSSISGCDRCGAESVYVKVKQTRSVDEGPTALFECPKCRTCWTKG